MSAKWLERLLLTKRCGGAARFGSVRLATDCLPDSGLAQKVGPICLPVHRFACMYMHQGWDHAFLMQNLLVRWSGAACRCAWLPVRHTSARSPVAVSEMQYLVHLRMARLPCSGAHWRMLQPPLLLRSASAAQNPNPAPAGACVHAADHHAFGHQCCCCFSFGVADATLRLH